MGLNLDEKKAILNYRIQKAEKALVEAKVRIMLIWDIGI